LLRNSLPKKDASAKASVAPLLSDDDLKVFLEHGENATKTAMNISEVPDHYSDLVIEYAMYMALMSNSLIEKGREFAFLDSGVTFTPPALADHMMQVARAVIDGWFKKVAFYKS
jgi:hypothetical protein